MILSDFPCDLLLLLLFFLHLHLLHLVSRQPLTRLSFLPPQERVGGHPSSLGPITSIGGVGGSASFASTPRIHTPTTDFQPPYFPPPYLGTENQMTVSSAPIVRSQNGSFPLTPAGPKA